MSIVVDGVNIKECTTQRNDFLIMVKMNTGQVVWERTLYLDLPQQSKALNLRSFINSKNPLGYRRIVVTNKRTQPRITSGNLSGLIVTLVNNGEIRGDTPGRNGLELSSSMKLTNNGWIRGAGKNGKSTSSKSLTYGTWITRKCFHESCVSAGTYCPRYYHRGSKKGAYRFSGAGACQSNGVIRWSGGSKWGDFDIVTHKNGFTFWAGRSDGTLFIKTSNTIKTTGQKGGIGISYTTKRTNGKKSAVSYNGFNYSNGRKMAGTLSSTSGDGGNWGTGGRAITGFGHLTSGSKRGKVSGSVS